MTVREILWVEQTDGAEFWMKVFNSLIPLSPSVTADRFTSPPCDNRLTHKIPDTPQRD